MVKKGSTLLVKRGIAYLLDLLIVNLIIVMPFNKVLETYGKASLFSLRFQQDATLSAVVFIILVLTLVYFSVLEYRVQQTIGKMIVGLYIYSKGKLDFKRVFIRNITKPFFLLLFLDCLYLFGRHGKRFTERISNTEVREL